MFLTSKEMFVELPLDLARDGWNQWHTVTQVMPARWFHVQYFTEDMLSEQTLMTFDLEVVQNINADENFRLINVGLVSPPIMNGTGEWSLSSLVSVVTLTMKDGDMERLLGYEYHLKTGHRIPEYIGGVGSRDSGEILLSEMKLHYTASSKIAHT